MPTLFTTAALAIGLAMAGHVTAATAAEPVTVAAPVTLTIRFTGIATPTGTVMLSVYASEADFDRGGKPVRAAMVPVKGDAAEAVFEGLAPGAYAVKAFHDVDGNGRMGTNPFGQPIEPYAFSNDAIGDAGPAKWAAARFEVAGPAASHSISIR
jgi:uncharacterized protein (DUF2141 family)